MPVNINARRYIMAGGRRGPRRVGLTHMVPLTVSRQRGLRLARMSSCRRRECDFAGTDDQWLLCFHSVMRYSSSYAWVLRCLEHRFRWRGMVSGARWIVSAWCSCCRRWRINGRSWGWISGRIAGRVKLHLTSCSSRT